MLSRFNATLLVPVTVISSRAIHGWMDGCVEEENATRFLRWEHQIESRKEIGTHPKRYTPLLLLLMLILMLLVFV